MTEITRNFTQKTLSSTTQTQSTTSGRTSGVEVKVGNTSFKTMGVPTEAQMKQISALAKLKSVGLQDVAAERKAIAQKRMALVRKRVEDLKKQLDEAVALGDRQRIKQILRELKQLAKEGAAAGRDYASAIKLGAGSGGGGAASVSVSAVDAAQDTGAESLTDDGSGFESGADQVLAEQQVGPVSEDVSRSGYPAEGGLIEAIVAEEEQLYLPVDGTNPGDPKNRIAPQATPEQARQSAILEQTAEKARQREAARADSDFIDGVRDTLTRIKRMAKQAADTLRAEKDLSMKDKTNLYFVEKEVEKFMAFSDSLDIAGGLAAPPPPVGMVLNASI